MFENYSVGAQRVVSLATTEARMLDHPRVGTEHLLLGLLSDADGDSADVLRTAGASLAAARHKVVEAVGDDAGSPDGEPLAFTARAQRALDRASRFSRKGLEAHVTARHVLLGVLDVEGLACQVLRGLGVDIVHLRLAVDASRSGVAAALLDEQPPTDPSPDPSTEVTRPWCPNCHASLDGTLAETQIPARRDGAPTTIVVVVYCSACGATLGAMPRDP